MFWGVTIENDKRYTQTVEASFHLSMAALDPNPPNVDINKSSTVSLWLQHDKAEFLLCTLEYGMLFQQPLDCNFTEGEEVTFFLNGQGVIHLTGYLIEDMSMAADSLEEPMLSSSEDDDSDESEDIPVLVDAKQLAKGAKKRTMEIKIGSKKKCKVDGEIKDSDESSDEDSETGDDDDEATTEEDFSEDSDDSDEEEVTSKKAQKSKPEVAKKNASNSLKQAQQTKSFKEQKLSQKLKNKEKKALANSIRSADDNDSLDKALLDASISSEKKKKKKKKKQAKVPEASNNSAPNIQESSTQSEESKSQSRVLGSGLVIEDTQVGQGSIARIGRQVHVYYSGKLAKSGKTFDRCINGKPFKFMLGKGEVISGWEKGLVGMRVGGKRTLTIPPKLGYSNQKAGPIPPNSSLIFDIELKAIS